MPVSSASAGTICPGDEHTGDDRTSHDRTSHDRTQAGLKPLPTAFDSPTPRNDLQPLTRENMNAAWVRRVSAGFREHGGFVVNSGHPLYAGKLSLQTEASHIARAAGEFGSCRAYLENTIDQLNAIGLSDGYLLRLQRQLAHMDHDAQFRRGAVEAPR